MSLGRVSKVHKSRRHVRDKCHALFIIPRLTRSSFDNPAFSSQACLPGFVIVSNIVNRVGQRRHRARRRSTRAVWPLCNFCTASCHPTLYSSLRLVSFPLPWFSPAIRTRRREEGSDVSRITKTARRTWSALLCLCWWRTTRWLRKIRLIC